ncbi:MAG TPA: lamin tail domain-containing protein, partial [bacterium]|nr:lamin tail domain-containing protein [bacterium]
YAGSKTANNAVDFNGDDAVVLYKISTTSPVDIIGCIGEDPGTAWTSGSHTTLDKTLVRKTSVLSGVSTNPGSGFPTLESEWDMYDDGDVSHLGEHNVGYCTGTAIISAIPQSGFGSAVITIPDSVAGTIGDSEQSISIKITGTSVYKIMETIKIEVPAVMTWTGNSADVSLSGTGFGGSPSKSVSGSGSSTDSWIITITGSTITNNASGTVTISNLTYDGGLSKFAANEPCTFVIKTSYRGYDAASITSNPGFFIHLGYDSLKISEIGHAYSGGPSDEFIEIYNKSEYKLNLKNVYIKYSAVATNPNSDGSGGSSLRLLGNSFINKKGYYLLGSGSYTGTGTAASDSSFADGSLGATGGHVYIVYSGAILDLLGYGDAAAYAEGSSPFATANIPDAASTGSIERKANASSDAASMASGGTDEFSGNGYDSNDNAADFLARTARNPQNSISGSEPSEVGRATIYPDNSVAAGGKGTWEIRFNAGISNWSNGQLSVQIPAGWTNPQKIDPAAAGYVTVSSNGTIASYSIDSTDTIVVNVT